MPEQVCFSYFQKSKCSIAYKKRYKSYLNSFGYSAYLKAKSVSDVIK